MMSITLPKFCLITTGGTIAGAASDFQNNVYVSASFTGQDLLTATCGIDELAEWQIIPAYAIGSQDVSLSHWLMLRKIIMAALADESIDAVVLTHGTDTLEETAFWLHLHLPKGTVDEPFKPIIMTAAMRPATALSSDGPANLWQAAAFARYLIESPRPLPIAIRQQKVWAVLQDHIYAPPNLQKRATTGVGAFGTVSYAQFVGKQIFWSAMPVDGLWPAGYLADEWEANSPALISNQNWPEVLLLNCQIDADMERLARWFNPWPAGCILAGFGHGNWPQYLLPLLRDAMDSGVCLVRSSRLSNGIVGKAVELAIGAASLPLNIPSAGILNAGQARIALQGVLMFEKTWPDELPNGLH